ncbi:hypothetical protein ACIOMM_36495 [Streptomyces sp. NPDC087908]|uniref:hypothetical protein n=1 Tax=Streptomyces sp. NPDC087908 TaxID=3365820 RepID=UPI00382550E2
MWRAARTAAALALIQETERTAPPTPDTAVRTAPIPEAAALTTTSVPTALDELEGSGWVVARQGLDWSQAPATAHG